MNQCFLNVKECWNRQGASIAHKSTQQVRGEAGEGTCTSSKFQEMLLQWGSHFEDPCSADGALFSVCSLCVWEEALPG